jgi:hypothetical protein
VQSATSQSFRGVACCSRLFRRVSSSTCHLIFRRLGCCCLLRWQMSILTCLPRLKKARRYYPVQLAWAGVDTFPHASKLGMLVSASAGASLANAGFTAVDHPPAKSSSSTLSATSVFLAGAGFAVVVHPPAKSSSLVFFSTGVFLASVGFVSCPTAPELCLFFFLFLLLLMNARSTVGRGSGAATSSGLRSVD